MSPTAVVEIGWQREMNEALLVSSVRQHELTEIAEAATFKLNKSQELLRFVMDSMPQKIFTANEVGEVTYFSPQWGEYSGMGFEEMRVLRRNLFIHADDRVANDRSWRHSVETGEPFLFECRLRRFDGHYRWHVNRALPMRNENEQIITWVGSCTDIDDARRAHDAARTELEREVKVRTAELVATNEQLEGFTYTVAHDLRQQIRGISSNASILLEDAADELEPESQKTLLRLINSSKGLSELVDDLLAYARLGRKQPNKKLLDLTLMAQETSAVVVERRSCGNGVQFRIEEGLAAMGDSQLIRIVIENLLDNACKYSAKSETPVIEIGRIGDAFFIRDEGIGFDMKFLSKLFQPFERLHGASAYPGTGIGLANVKRIVEKHGGKVWAEGRPGEGATFFFTLP